METNKNIEDFDKKFEVNNNFDTTLEHSDIDESGNILNDLARTETEMTNRTLQLLKMKYQREKENWNTLYAQREAEISGLKLKLQETQNKLKALLEKYDENRIVEIEKGKAQIEEIKLQKLQQEEKWKAIEQEIKFYKQITEITQNKLNEEQKRYIDLKEFYTKEEQKFREKINEYEEILMKQRQEIIDKQQSLLTTQSKYQEEIEQLKEKIKKLEDDAKQQRQEYLDVINKKDEEINKLQKTLQDTAIQILQQKHREEDLIKEINIKNKQIDSLQQQNKSILVEVEQERKNWKQAWDEEKKEWEKYRQEAIEKEKLLKEKTEEQLNNIISSMNSVEENLKSEIQKRINLEKYSKELEMNVNKLQQEKQNLEKIINEHNNIFELKKQEISQQYANLIAAKESQIKTQENEILQLKGELAEINKIYKLEKQTNNDLKKQIEFFNDEKKRFENSISVRDEEIKKLEMELNTANGELFEVRSMFQEVRTENQQQKFKIIELEKELEKVSKQLENERSKWENLLVSEQNNWQKNRQQLILEATAAKKDLEEEIRKLVSEINILKERNQKFEDQLIEEKKLSEEYKQEYNKLYEELMNQKKQNVYLAKKIQDS